MTATHRVGTPAAATAPTGCYGLALPDLTDAAHLLRPVPADAPVLRVTQSRGAPTGVADVLGADRASFAMARDAGGVHLDRAARTAHFTTVRPLPHDHLVHPHLALVAAVHGHWLGRDVLHAGAFDVGGRAWGVLGARDAGKSSLVVQAHLLGRPVVTDDVAVLADRHVLPGPGLVDLRRSAAEHLGLGTPMGVVGRRERWRVPVPPTGPTPLAGWIVPAWGPEDLQPVPPVARVPLLAGSSALRRPPADPARFFDLAGFPVLLWHRPRDWARMAASTELLLARLSERG